MADFKTLVRSRGGYRAMATRYGDSILALPMCKAGDVEQELTLETLFTEFTRYVAKIAEVQDSIEAVIEPEDMPADQANVCDYFNRSILPVQVRYKQILRQMESSQKEEVVSNIPSIFRLSRNFQNSGYPPSPAMCGSGRGSGNNLLRLLISGSNYLKSPSFSTFGLFLRGRLRLLSLV